MWVDRAERRRVEEAIWVAGLRSSRGKTRSRCACARSRAEKVTSLVHICPLIMFHQYALASYPRQGTVKLPEARQ